MIELLSADDFYQIIIGLPARRANLQSYGTNGTIAANGAWIGPQISSADLAAFQVELVRMHAVCALLSLPASLRSVNTLRQYIAEGGRDAAHMFLLFVPLHSHFIPEIQEQRLGPILSHRLEYCRPAKDLFGEQVLANFSRLEQEIEDAAVSYALGLFTACVCHLMRIVEEGLNAVAHDLKISYVHAQWEPIINKIPGKKDALENESPKRPDWKEWRQFYADAYLKLDNLNHAHRIYAMHSLKHYEETETRLIYETVRNLMQHLAAKLKQTPA